MSTNHAYGAVSSALDRLSARTGASRVVAHVPFDTTDEEVVAIISEHCSERTALVVLDQVTSPTARRFPIEPVACVAHRFNAALLVDGAHAPGMLPLEVPKLGADFWVGNLHKWACAPPGTGVLWVAPQWREQMLSLVVSWGEAEGFPTSFERVGTDDLTAWVAAPYSLRLLGSLGWDRVRAHNEALVVWAQATVAEILGPQASELRHDPGISMACGRCHQGSLTPANRPTQSSSTWQARGSRWPSAPGTGSAPSGFLPTFTTGRLTTSAWRQGSATSSRGDLGPSGGQPGWHWELGPEYGPTTRAPSTFSYLSPSRCCGACRSPA